MNHKFLDFFAPPMAKNQIDTCVLVICGAACIIIYFLFSDLKGISTDEGIRLGVMNGNMPFSSREGAPTASWSDVIRANGTTNYQPLYYLLQNLVIRIANSHNFVLLKSVNIAFVACCIAISISLTRSWPLMPRTVLILGTYANGYALMQVLQIKEYALGLVFLSLLYWHTISFYKAQRRPFNYADTVSFFAYGVLLGLASINTFWIIPAFGGAIVFLLIFSPNRINTVSRLSISFVGFAAIMFVQYWVYGFGGKVIVGHWDPDYTVGRLWTSMKFAGAYILSGEVVPTTSDFVSSYAVLAVCLMSLSWIDSRRNNITDDDGEHSFLFSHSMLSFLMLLSLLAFQIVHFFLLDPLSVWPRYFFQHHWLVHLFIGCNICYFYNLLRTEKLFGLRRLIASGWVLVSAAVVFYWSVSGTLSYYRFPLADTGLSQTCNWGRFASRLKAELGHEPIVFSRLLEALTVTASEDFENEMHVWKSDNFDRIPENWPQKFTLLNLLGTMSPQDTADQLMAMTSRGYEVVEEKMITSDEARSCSIRGRLVRVRSRERQ